MTGGQQSLQLDAGPGRGRPAAPARALAVRTLIAVALALVLGGLVAAPATAAAHETWNDVVDEMAAVLDESYDIYLTGDAEAAKDQVDVAYYGYYEKLGFEKTVMSYISGNRAATVEYQFAFTKKAMLAGDPDAEIRASLDELTTLLREDANQLDGEQESASGAAVASFVIILREGFEAIIVVGAIIAYLVKSGNGDKVKAVYWGSLIALGASVVLAVLLNLLTGLSGANQELIEGFTMLVAVVMLIYVSNWILSKSEGQAWTRYLEDKTESSLTRGSVFSLAFVAFLAVFREGAEVILFYQALLARTSTHVGAIWLGFGIGIVVLAVVYLLIRVLSIRLPLRPFFLGTSILLSVMAFTFVGSGIKELQEGNAVSATPVAGISSIDLLGIYPTVETLAAQAVVLILMLAMFAVGLRKGRKAREQATASAAELAEPA